MKNWLPAESGSLERAMEKNAALMAAIIKFRFDFVASITGSVATLLCRIFGQRIAPLDHEAFDNPVKRRAIVKSRACQFLEILDRVGRHLRPEFGNHFALAGLNHRYFFC